MNYNIKDIYLERSKTNQTFEEFPLVVQPNAVVITDSGSNLRTTPIATLLSGISGSSISGNVDNLYVSGSASFHGIATFENPLLTIVNFTHSTSGLVEAQFGYSLPLYAHANFPALGFNAYYDATSGFTFGAGSSNQYACFQAFSLSDGLMSYYISSVVGNAGTSWTPGVPSLVLGPNGIVKMPTFSIPGILGNDSTGVVTSTTNISASAISASVVSASVISANTISALSFHIVSSSAAPINQTTASKWMSITVNSSNYFIPLYQ